MKLTKILQFCAIVVTLSSCNDNDEGNYTNITVSYPAVEAEFGSSVDLNNLANYANQAIPSTLQKTIVA
jgi:cytochrome c peroxidase